MLELIYDSIYVVSSFLPRLRPGDEIYVEVQLVEKRENTMLRLSSSFEKCTFFEINEEDILL